MSRRIPSLLLSILGVALAPSQARTAEEPPPRPNVVSVTLASGRTFTAAVDVRTDNAVLWLRFDDRSGTLLRPVAWNRVTGALYDGRPVSPQALMQLVPRIRTGREQPAWIDAENTPQPVAEHCAGTGQAPAGQAPASQASEAPATAGPVRTLRAEAYVAHWDANTEADGILLSVSPLDQSGRVVPVSGTLDVELIGQRRGRLEPQPIDRREQFSRLGSWTDSVRPEQLVDGQGAEFRLPFQAIHPEFDPAVDENGLLRVRLAIPGQGVFETSVSDLRIRPIDTFRDRIENSTGRRFLTEEQTGR